MEKKFNIKLPPELHTKVKLISVLKSTTMNEYIEQAIRQAVEQDKELVKDIPIEGGEGQ